MPYIKDGKIRQQLDKVVWKFQIALSMKPITGQLNYFLFKLAKKECHTYKEYRNFIGELEAAKLEIYRRQVAPYEDEAKKRNGDVE